VNRATTETRLSHECPSCGRRARVPAELAGRKIRCSRCGEAARAPGERKERAPRAEKPTPEPAVRPERAPTVRPERRVAPAAAGFVRFYWILILAFLPLALDTFSKDKTVARFEATVEQAPPAVAKRVLTLVKSNAEMDVILAQIPENRIAGAYLARDTKAHWGLAALSTAFFLVLLSVLFPWRESVAWKTLLLVGVFTGTVGIIFLYFLATCFAPSYAFADDAQGSIFTHMFGYTTGVGFSEEAAKALPLILFFLSGRSMDWRRACLWGLASGLGFGISEAISYAGNYNGIATGQLYLVRFVSCVALHAILAASAAMVIAERQTELKGVKDLRGLRWFLVRALAAPMLLHGFYDTLLTHDQQELALLTAIGAFVWFASEVERLEQKAPALVRA
jgi:RsiW-degrading membrane proteinase PrsW (M82 family)